MKRLLSLLLSLIGLMASGSAETHEETYIDIEPVLFESLTLFPYEELQLIPDGFCQSDETLCFYGWNDDDCRYCFLKNNQVISRHQLKHPKRPDGAPGILQLFAEDDRFYMAVLDWVTGESYLAIHPIGEDEPIYGEIIDAEIHVMAVGADACFCAGYGNGSHFIASFSKEGDLLWLKEVKSTGFDFQACWMDGDVFCTLACSSYQAIMRISKWDCHGNLIQQENFAFKDAPYTQTSAKYVVYQAAMADREIIVAGHIQSHTDESCAFCFRFNHALQLTEAKFYDRWDGIKHFVFDGDELFLLACPKKENSFSNPSELRTYAHYLVSYDGSIMIPLERSHQEAQTLTKTLAIGTNDENQMYLFGSVWPSSQLHHDSTFIGILNWKNFFPKPD